MLRSQATEEDVGKFKHKKSKQDFINHFTVRIQIKKKRDIGETKTIKRANMRTLKNSLNSFLYLKSQTKVSEYNITSFLDLTYLNLKTEGAKDYLCDTLVKIF